MSTRLDEKIASEGYENLINDLYPPTDVYSVKMRKGSAETTYKRGTALAIDGNGKMVILGTTAGSGETLTANAVLAEDVTVGTSVDANAIAYRTGHFNTNALIVASGYTITATDKEAFRSAGILLSDAIEI